MNSRSDVSVLIPTSVIPSHPSTHILDWCVASVRSHLFDAPIFVMADGVRNEQRDREPDYNEFKRRLVFPPWSGKTELVAFSTFHHQAAMMRQTMAMVTTPLVLFIEHDWLLTGEIPWDAMAQTILERKADVIRLHQEQQTHPEHAHLFGETVEINGIRLRKQLVFWAQPHIAAADWYRKQLAEKFSPYARTMIEDRLYGINLDGQPWENNKIFMYDPLGGLKRVSHTDGRGKHEDGSPLVSKFDDRFIF